MSRNLQRKEQLKSTRARGVIDTCDQGRRLDSVAFRPHDTINTYSPVCTRAAAVSRRSEQQRHRFGSQRRGEKNNSATASAAVVKPKLSLPRWIEIIDVADGALVKCSHEELRRSRDVGFGRFRFRFSKCWSLVHACQVKVRQDADTLLCSRCAE